MRWMAVVLTVLLAASPLVAAEDPPAAVAAPAPAQPALRLDPTPIARAFTRHPSVVDPCGLFRLARLDPPRLEPEEEEAPHEEDEGQPEQPAEPAIQLAPGLAVADFEVVRALTFSGRDSGLAGAVSRLQSRLFLGVGTYGSGDSGELYDGLSDSLDVSARGRTVRSDDGRVLGDLTLAVGTTASRAGVLQWWQGQADFLDLNPFRDISAQFDLAILSSERAPDASVMVLRVRGSYLGAFGDTQRGSGQGGVAPEVGDSELGLSFGLKF